MVETEEVCPALVFPPNIVISLEDVDTTKAL
jgi:hypothetical protein